MPQEETTERVVIHGDLIPFSHLQSETLESLWPSQICNMCGHEFTAESTKNGATCPDVEPSEKVGRGLGACRPRIRTLEVAIHLMKDLLAPNKDGELLAFAKTGPESVFVDEYFSSIKSVSLFGNYGNEHLMGVDVRDLSRFDAESFSGVFSVLLFDYFPEHEQALSEIWRVLSPGAIFFTHIAPYRLLDDHTQPFIHKRVEAKPGSFEYLGAETIPDIKVGKYWLHETIDRCGFDSCTVDIYDSISGQVMTWFIGRKRAKKKLRVCT